MTESQTDRDEQELQELLEAAPERRGPPDDMKCIFCENPADLWVSTHDVGLDEFEEFNDVDFVGVCSDCWQAEEDECVVCMFGNYCPKHITEDEWILKQIVESLGMDEEEIVFE